MVSLPFQTSDRQTPGGHPFQTLSSCGYWKTAPGGKFQVITRTRLAYIAYPIWRNNFQDPMYSHLTCSWWFSLIFSYHHHKCHSFHLMTKSAPLSKWTYLTGRSTGCLTLNPMTREPPGATWISFSVASTAVLKEITWDRCLGPPYHGIPSYIVYNP